MALAACSPIAVLAQLAHPRISAQAIFAATRAEPIPGGGSLTEMRVVQPLVMLAATMIQDRLFVHATANFEGWTIPNGELAPGNWGEGFVDRRHPHTYVHELVLTGTGPAGTRLSAGKGLVPFGTDDPMSRPALRYPVNHHLAQILERWVVIAGIDRGPVTLEAAVFDGDEPEYPGQWPALSRFGDSWSARLIVRPLAGLEWQGSVADVHSPEHRLGAGTDQHKASTALRLERTLGGIGAYALAEWARTSEAAGTFVFHSVLAEGALSVRRHRPYYRFERTERPEEQRSFDLFRAPRPHLENSLIGVTRWTVHTAGYGFVFTGFHQRLALQPFVEASYGRITAVGGGIFDPPALYGRSSFWSASLGVRAGWAMTGHRMGRYGVPREPTHSMEME